MGQLVFYCKGYGGCPAAEPAFGGSLQRCLRPFIHSVLEKAKKNRPYLPLAGRGHWAVLFLAYSTQTIGITDTTPGKNAFLTAIYCVIVPFLFWLVGRQRPDIYNFTAAVLCIAGIGFVSLTQAFTIGFGDALTLLGGFLFAAHLVAVTKFGSDKDPVLITILQFFFAAVFSWITTLISEPFPTAVSVDCVWGVAYLSIFCTAGALLLQNIGQKYTNPSAAAIILSLESVFGVLFSVLFGYETLTPKLIFGFVLIFAAVLLSETKLSFIKKKKLF